MSIRVSMLGTLLTVQSVHNPYIGEHRHVSRQRFILDPEQANVAGSGRLLVNFRKIHPKILLECYPVRTTTVVPAVLQTHPEPSGDVGQNSGTIDTDTDTPTLVVKGRSKALSCNRDNLTARWHRGS